MSERSVTSPEHDWVELQKRASAEFDRRVSAVVDWAAPTPDVEWNIAQLVRHVIEEQQWVPLLLAGRSIAEAQLAKRALSADLAAEWRHYTELATAAWESSSLESPVQLSYDTVTAGEYLAEQVADITIHTWDLARATGSEEDLDPQLVAAVWTVFEPQKDTLVASGLYAPPVPLPDGAPLQTRLLALTGRDAGVRG